VFAVNDLRFETPASAVISNTDSEKVDNDGWVAFHNFNGSNLVSDSEWLSLVSSMKVGIKVQNNATGKNILYPIDLLTDETICSNIYDVKSLREPNFKDEYVVLYHEEISGCTAKGLDYAYVTLDAYGPNEKLYVVNPPKSYPIDYSQLDIYDSENLTYFIK
jgi:hypothetical protein